MYTERRRYTHDGRAFRGEEKIVQLLQLQCVRFFNVQEKEKNITTAGAITRCVEILVVSWCVFFLLNTRRKVFDETHAFGWMGGGLAGYEWDQCPSLLPPHRRRHHLPPSPLLPSPRYYIIRTPPHVFSVPYYIIILLLLCGQVNACVGRCAIDHCSTGQPKTTSPTNFAADIRACII